MKLCRCPLKGNEGQRAIHGAVWNPSDLKIMERGVYISDLRRSAHTAFTVGPANALKDQT